MRKIHKIALVLFLFAVCANLVSGRATERYTKPQIIKLLIKTFPDWQGDKSEKLVFVVADGQVFTFGGGPNAVSGSLLNIIRTLARKGQHLGTVTNVFHSHKWPDGFSPTDVALCKTLRKIGFTGEFQIFYPETRRIKTLDKEDK